MMLNQVPSAKRQCRSPSIRSANSPHRSPTHSTARAVRGRRRTRFAKARRCSKPQKGCGGVNLADPRRRYRFFVYGGRSSPQLSLAFIASGARRPVPTGLTLNRGPSTQCQFRPASIRRTFHSIADLQAAIYAYLAEHNASPKPFVWTQSEEAIMAKLDRLPVTFV
jgi:hypothetical protein